MASGRLVVSSLLSGMAAFPLDEMILCKEDSSEAFADAISKAVDMGPEKRVEKGRRTRDWARTHFDWDRIAGDLIEFLEEKERVIGLATDATENK
jgi:glycosyltransferase involved in cell wall biosynthesis